MQSSLLIGQAALVRRVEEGELLEVLDGPHEAWMFQTDLWRRRQLCEIRTKMQEF